MDQSQIENLLKKLPFEYESVYDVPELIVEELCRKKYFHFSLEDFDDQDHVFKLFITKGKEVEGKEKSKIILYYFSPCEVQCLSWINFDTQHHGKFYFWKKIIDIVSRDSDPKSRLSLLEEWKKLIPSENPKRQC